MSLEHQILGNPHCTGPSASKTLKLMDQVRKEVLEFFSANPSLPFSSLSSSKSVTLISSTIRDMSNLCDLSGNDEDSNSSTDDTTLENDNHDDGNSSTYQHVGYDVIFTSGATEALELVATHFPWQKESVLLYSHNAHTSVVGMRGEATSHGASFQCENLSAICNADAGTFSSWASRRSSTGTERDNVCNLVVVPLECNALGDRLDLTNMFRSIKNANSIGCITSPQNTKKQSVHASTSIKAASTTKYSQEKESDEDHFCNQRFQ